MTTGILQDCRGERLDRAAGVVGNQHIEVRAGDENPATPTTSFERSATARMPSGILLARPVPRAGCREIAIQNRLPLGERKKRLAAENIGDMRVGATDRNAARPCDQLNVFQLEHLSGLEFARGAAYLVSGCFCGGLLRPFFVRQRHVHMPDTKSARVRAVRMRFAFIRAAPE